MENHKLVPLNKSELTSYSGGYTWWYVLATLCMLYDGSEALVEGVTTEANSILKEKGW